MDKDDGKDRRIRTKMSQGRFYPHQTARPMRENKMSTYTPWGYADHQETIAKGIISYSTPSHGGFFLSDDRLSQMPAALRAIKTWAGKNWFEEDCDWAIVCLAFPEYFSDDECYYAIQQARRSSTPDPNLPPNLSSFVWPIDVDAYLLTPQGALCANKASTGC